jgi:signal transduction histidine kinase
VTEKTFLHCPAGVRQQFPDSPIPARLGAESYCGFCLYDSAARPIGILSVMDDKPMPDPSLAESVLRIFAARAGAEVERLRAEDEARRLEKRMHEMRKLESLGVLAGGIAHDFNNLLAVIQGNMELLLLDTPPDSQASPMLKAVEASALKAAHLCRQMVAYAGKAHISMNEVDFNLLVRDVCGSQWVCTARNVRAKYELAAALPGIHADPRQLSYILLYLLTNAEEAIGEHDGVITVRTGVMRCDREYLLQTHGEDEPAVGEYAFLEVADTGCGMSGDVKARLFEPFFTTKFPGRGLGLAAVHGIVHAHKGAIHVESECGKGTTVRVLFPVA